MRFFIILLTAFLFQGSYCEAKPLKTRASTKEVERDDQGRRVVYKQKNVVNFDSMLLEGDIKNPNEFYFVHRPEEKFGTLVKKRPHFHKEMLRDAVMIQ